MPENILKKYFDGFIWDLYAGAYDDLARYYSPYKELVAEVEKSILARLKKGRILDAGCGTGEFSLRLAPKGYMINAIDISSSMLKVFSRKRGDKWPKVNVEKADLNQKLKFRDNYFDALISIHSLFMLENIPAVVAEYARVLKKGGWLVVSHNRPVNLPELFRKEFAVSGFAGVMSGSVRLFKVGMINFIIGGMHKKLYGIVTGADIIKGLRKEGFKLECSKVMYRGFDDFFIMRKK